MARIYQSRALLDPSILNMAEQAKQNYINQNRNIIDRQAKAWSENLPKIAGFIGSGIQQSIRQSMLDDAEEEARGELKWSKKPTFGVDEATLAENKKFNAGIDNKLAEMKANQEDPMYLAAKQKFIETGDPSAMNAYKQNVLMQQARMEEAKRKAIEDANAKALHDEVAMRSARPDFIKIMDKYVDPSTSESERNILGEQMKALQIKYPGIESGVDVEKLREAKAVDAKNKLEAEKKENERRLKVTNFLASFPESFKDKTAKDAAIAEINANSDMTNAEKDAAIKTIQSMESEALGTHKRIKSETDTKAAKKTGEKMDEAEARKKYGKYVGSKNRADWLRIPAQYRGTLFTRDLTTHEIQEIK